MAPKELDFTKYTESINKKMEDLERVLNKINGDVGKTLSVFKCELQIELQNVTKMVKCYASEIEMAHQRIEFLEQNQLCNDITITGIPYDDKIKVDDIFRKISASIQYNDGISSTSNIFWRKSKLSTITKSTFTPIVVRFISHRHKSSFFYKYFIKKNLSLNQIGYNSTTRIFCNDSLTKKSHLILRQALNIKKSSSSNNILKVFTKFGQVFIKDKLNKIIKISSVDQLLNDFNDQDNPVFNEPNISYNNERQNHNEQQQQVHQQHEKQQRQHQQHEKQQRQHQQQEQVQQQQIQQKLVQQKQDQYSDVQNENIQPEQLLNMIAMKDVEVITGGISSVTSVRQLRSSKT